MADNKKKFKWVWRNLLAAVIMVVMLVFVAQIVLSLITRHNKMLTVPDFSYMTIDNAQKLASRRHVRIEVSDSVYVKRVERGVIYSQTPAVGSKVKKNRLIFLTINAIAPRMVEMPLLVGYSLRQAKTELYSKGLKLGELRYVEDIATNNVLGQYFNGTFIPAGRELEVESEIDLVLGLNDSNEMTYIPYLVGYTTELAKDALFENSLNIGKITYDETVTSYDDTLKAVVYSQSPSFTNDVPYPLGARVDIALTLNQSKIVAKKPNPSETLE